MIALRFHRLQLCSFFLVFILGSCHQELPEEVQTAYEELPEKIDFNFHVKPILSDRCYACHGPDQNSRKASLRLDTEEGAFEALESGGRAFVAGNFKKSMAIQRMLSHDPEFIMPPPESNLHMTAEEVAIIAKWVKQGAEWKGHWSFIPPESVEIPDPVNPDWQADNAIDHFVLQELSRQGLTPSPRAGKERLLRRVTMDLTGLPPTIEEIDNFLEDSSPNAYEKVVDRLLGSESYGERMAMEWMDLARYADSHGMHADGWRLMWPWRDWVIKSFNENMPYDKFVTWQLAGDLLPNATKEQILATAFHRNHPMTAEGGVIDEEFRMEYVADRTNTTATAFLGLTMSCAKCHDHKFDPISQEDYFQMFSFFNNIKELGMTGDDGNYGPMLLLTDEETDALLEDLDEKIQNKEKALDFSQEDINSIRDFVGNNSHAQKDPAGLIGYYPFDKVRKGKNKNGHEVLIIDENRKSTSPGNPVITDGKIGKALMFEGDYNPVQLSDMGIFEMTDPFSAAAWINASKTEKGKTQVILGNTGSKNNFWRGWDFFLDSLDQLSARLIHSLPHNYIQVTSNESIPANTWTHVSVTYDGSGRAEGLQLFINGSLAAVTVDYDRLYKSVIPVTSSSHQPDNRALQVGKSYRAFSGENGIYKGKIDEIKIFDRKLSHFEVGKVAGLESPPADSKALAVHLLEQDKKHRQQLADLKKLRQEKLAIMDTISEVMVMEEMPESRTTHVLERGQYDAPGKQVNPGTPQHVLAFPDSLPANRLGLAQWLFSEANPLTSRVTVNRYWQMFFGQGLVKSLYDFGNQGDLPTHPELLDWLSISFMENGWNLKSLCKLIVMSSTYQQSSVVRPELKEKDPYNALLARGSSYRWPAEMIRDNALAASGLLSKKVGGQSVKPYQPEGLWIELGNFSHILLHYKPDSGEKLYRRSMYTFIRRTSPPPFMITFDAPNRDICILQRERTNTPLQALVLLNDPQFVESSRVLAERMQLEGGDNLDTQITYAFRLTTGRKPKTDELTLLKSLYEKERQRFTEDPEQANQLLAVGEKKKDKTLDVVKTAALAMLVNTIQNHDETYMKR
ncbi:DUF1553 domain-containing protein [Fulvivirgaceae bacterium BMA12]|uniref:DUF1553 domain-containing protein n=1 Tax=Agaribacillus aureus TaxID=3051825 RepID=A0ABT8L6Y8_9BACT|nr:DUF1553 domain-containing protein [Fulvivirgaceae bacterium BMA12]